MAIDFPASPTNGQIFSPPGGPTYIYDSPRWLLTSTSTAQTRNRVCNPAMQVSQENSGTAGTTANYYAADQWAMYKSHSAGTMTASQASLGYYTPNRNAKAFRVTITAADASLAAGEYLSVGQPIEYSRVNDFAWGYPEAKPVVARFGFRGPAGTYAFAMTNYNETRSYVASFTITAGQANTSTEQVFAIPGDTAGTWAPATRYDLGGYFYITLAAGSTLAGTNATWQVGPKYGVTGMTNGMGTAGSVFDITDVGLYLDPLATGVAPRFEMPDEAEELVACMRYWYKSFDGALFVSTYTAPSAGHVGYQHPVTMRVIPAISETGGGQSNFPAPPSSFLTTAPDGFSCYRTGIAAGMGYFYNTVTANARM